MDPAIVAKRGNWTNMSVFQQHYNRSHVNVNWCELLNESITRTASENSQNPQFDRSQRQELVREQLEFIDTIREEPTLNQELFGMKPSEADQLEENMKQWTTAVSETTTHHSCLGLRPTAIRGVSSQDTAVVHDPPTAPVVTTTTSSSSVRTVATSSVSQSVSSSSHSAKSRRSSSVKRTGEHLSHHSKPSKRSKSHSEGCGDHRRNDPSDIKRPPGSLCRVRQ